MANDREVLREIWDGSIPACFQLDTEEVIGLQKPEDFYLMIPRMLYLPLVTDKVKKHFLRFVPNEYHDNEMWFSWNTTPLKWHYPIGLLFDLMNTSNSISLPWVLTVHFSKFPEDVIFRCPTKETVEAHFLSCLKEADFLKHRGTVMQNMQKKDHVQLWLGLMNDKFDQFWAVNRRLMEQGADAESDFKNIPLRCYNEDGTYRQKLITPSTETGQKRSLQNLLDEFSTPVRKAVAAKTHGIDLPTDTPLQWLSEHMSYPDNFLHLCLTFEDASDA